jgi:hypothetical protein
MRSADPLAIAADRNHWRDRANVVRERLPLLNVVSRVVKLKHLGGPEWVGLCPFHSEKTPSFTVNTKKGFYHCFGCSEHGQNAIDFVMRRNGQDFKDVVELLESENGLRAFAASSVPPKPKVRQSDDAWKMRLVERSWAESVEIQPGSVVDRYLRGRALVPPALYGIGDPAVNAGWPCDIRFHAELWHSDARRGLPAMVAAFRRHDGQLAAIHRTYLRITGQSVIKAGTKRDKMHLGDRRGTFIRLSEIAPRMGGGEGIETSLSAMQLERRAGLAFGAADAMRVVELPFLCEDFVYWADWNAKSRVGEHAAWAGAHLKANATGRRIMVRVPHLRHLEKADFNDLGEQLRAAASRYDREARGALSTTGTH